ncbi:type II restriction endonuclease [Thioalkalivibrio sp. AKL12]|uniref:type II restriction endonuclease n=1 Tax=Thioalkalivibrio sp. AKL12 TaxID=1158159 RepID=UPI0009DA0515|nr:type II restriction endonuclease [Thioalkalivibrio sp. AKL12]
MPNPKNSSSCPQPELQEHRARPCIPHLPPFPARAKTTCKERWRHVLAEGKRLTTKYLATLETGISRTHTDEMLAQNLQLVIAEPVHASYQEEQRTHLLPVKGSIERVKSA